MKNLKQHLKVIRESSHDLGNSLGVISTLIDMAADKMLESDEQQATMLSNRMDKVVDEFRLLKEAVLRLSEETDDIHP